MSRLETRRTLTYIYTSPVPNVHLAWALVVGAPLLVCVERRRSSRVQRPRSEQRVRGEVRRQGRVRRQRKRQRGRRHQVRRLAVWMESRRQRGQRRRGVRPLQQRMCRTQHRQTRTRFAARGVRPQMLQEFIRCCESLPAVSRVPGHPAAHERQLRRSGQSGQLSVSVRRRGGMSGRQMKRSLRVVALRTPRGAHRSFEQMRT